MSAYDDNPGVFDEEEYFETGFADEEREVPIRSSLMCLRSISLAAARSWSMQDAPKKRNPIGFHTKVKC